MKNLFPATRADSATAAHTKQLRYRALLRSRSRWSGLWCVAHHPPDLILAAARYCLARWACWHGRAARWVADDETLPSSFGSESP